MPIPIVPATPAFDAAGTPYSTEYGDIYHAADSGPGQARHVFLGGNDLPARWREARVFTILETGFGLGLNFLATWAAWRADPARPQHLHYVSIEKHPFTREGLAQLHARYPELAKPAGELRAAWPPLLPGLHRLHFENGRVTLTLVLADVTDIVPKLRLAADAFYLDGHAPDRNPDMWTPAIIRALARLARAGATAATYTTARSVRDALAAAGFTAELRPGFGRKREMLAARFAPPRHQAAAAARPAPLIAPAWSERRAIVIGAGLAGAGCAERLAARGWQVDLIERHAGPAAEASGMAAGIVHPQVSRDDGALSRLTRAGFLYALARWQALEAGGRRFAWTRCGVLQLGRDAREARRMTDSVRALGGPPDYVRCLAREETAALAGVAAPSGGLWFPGGGWLRPAELVAALLDAAAPAVTFHYGRAVDALERDGSRWLARAPGGAVLAAAPVVVLANSHDAERLVPHGAQLKHVRGQLTCLPPGSLASPRAVLCGAGHLVPTGAGGAVVGSTYDFGDDDPEPSARGHAGNLERLELLLPGAAAGLDPARLDGTVGFRCVTTDRLPLIGALPDARAVRVPLTPRSMPRLAGLYGAYGYASRGLTWSALGGELIASLIEGEPLPVEGDLAEAVDPGRFLLRRARRGRPFTK